MESSPVCKIEHMSEHGLRVSFFDKELYVLFYQHVHLWNPFLIKQHDIVPLEIDDHEVWSADISPQTDEDKGKEDLCRQQTKPKRMAKSLARVERKLKKHLPDNLKDSPWTAIFSTEEDGYSLQSIYRKVEEREEPFFLAIEDSSGDVFGSFMTAKPKITTDFVGTGKSWLFYFDHNEDVVICPWSGKNDYFMQGRNDALILGADDGKFGIYLDEDLNNGRLQICSTYTGWPKEEKDFRVKCLQIWNFQ